MKNITLLVVAAMGINTLIAQTANTNQTGSTYIQCAKFHETIPIKDMPLQTEEQRIKAAAHHEMLEERREARRPDRKVMPEKQKSEPDPVVQTADGIKALTAPIVNFDGYNNNGSCPNDPDGAVGLTQYVQAYNSSYVVYDKTGKLLKGPVDLASIFPDIPNDDGDPVVLYDKFADRWFISEFQTSADPCGFCIAISKTGDATGAYYVYYFTNATWTTAGTFPDYLKFSIWTDGYYMTANLGWSPSGSYIQPQQIMVCDRARMLAGKASAGMIVQNYTFSPITFGGSNSLWNDAKIMDCDASALPPYGTPNYLVFYQNTNEGCYSDMIIIDKLKVDTAAKTLTISRWDSLAPSAFNGYFTGGSEKDITQPGSPNSLDALDGTFNFRVPFLAFTGYNSVVLSNPVNTGSNVAGIRWYELRQNTSTLHFTINQQGTYAPADGASRWNGSIGMDQDGNIAISYAVSSSSIYPSLRYNGRMSGDAAGTITGTEQTAIAGSTPAINCANRFGDYSEMTLDPSDGLTFWNTNEYDGAGAENNRIFSFKLGTTTGFTSPIDLSVFKVYQNGDYLNVIANTLPSNDDVHVDLFDIIGKQISAEIVKPAGNAIETKIAVNGLAKGAYLVRIGNINYQRVIKVIVN
ncbi:MAG TPA: T9SS type A sorting domain-containing protein [Bacteroidia bacterium]|nr:T9SS type A sorting domain-containing protein [Bacteroidia bacterium]